MKADEEDPGRTLAALGQAAHEEGLSIQHLQALIEEASDLGAKRALARIGLHDDRASNDMRDLRNLLDSWRETRRTMWRTVVKWTTTLIMIFIAAGVAVKFQNPFWD